MVSNANSFADARASCLEGADRREAVRNTERTASLEGSDPAGDAPKT